MTWVKICGCTSWDDVSIALDAGADAVGFVFAPSPRRITLPELCAIARRLPERIEAVGVFVNPSGDEVEAARSILPQMRLQFCGDEPPELVARYGSRAIKAIGVGGCTSAELQRRAAAYEDALLLFDTAAEGRAGGTGKRFAWSLVAAIAQARPIVVAGGLTPENVAECVKALRPFGVDVRSGVESGDRKDPRKVRAFVERVRTCDAA
jgi:phosphoribosylanthranilate isomerase